ncbi:MAG: CrcB family protein [Candidatus Amulumruptor sp.]|nr:CrcB family protein [Candidatus Amulumruptor sp.]
MQSAVASPAMLTQILAVGLGGMTGASLRFLAKSLPALTSSALGHTLAVNLTGSLAIGIMWVILARLNASPIWSLLLITGLLGGYTTCSAFALDCRVLISRGEWGTALAYWSATAIGSPAACALGWWITSRIIKF